MIVVLWSSAVALVLVISVAVSLWVVYAPVAARGLAEMPWLPSRLPALTPDDYAEGIFEAETVFFDTEDGVRLAGTYLPTTARHRKGVIIFCHELRGTRWTSLTFTGGFRDEGFDILAFDFRNHGDSTTQPGHLPIPWATTGEAADIRAAIDYCCRRDEALAGHVVLFGLSRGASAALCVAGTDSRVRAAVLDSIVPTEYVQLYLIKRFMQFHTHSVLWFSRWPDWTLRMLTFWANRIIEWRHGSTLLRVDRAAQRMHKPVLLIHGSRDAFVPLETIGVLRKRMRSRPRLWVVPQARHNETVLEAGGGYTRRVARFLTRHVPAEHDGVGAAPAPAFAGLAMANEGRTDNAHVAR